MLLNFIISIHSFDELNVFKIYFKIYSKTHFKSYFKQIEGTNYNLENNGIGHLNKTIASSSLRLLNFVAYLELSHQTKNTGKFVLEKINFKHIFVEITGESIYQTVNHNLINSASDYSQLEDIDIKQISDKFLQNKNGLKDLYDKGPQDAFFLVKCWVSLF